MRIIYIIQYLVLMSSEDQYTWWDRDIVLRFVVDHEEKEREGIDDQSTADDGPDKCTVSTTHGGSSRMTHSLTRRPMFSCMVGNTTMKIIRVVTYYRYYFYLHFARALFGYDDDMWCITSTKYTYLCTLYSIIKACIFYYYIIL